jgi:hypothetical protein
MTVDNNTPNGLSYKLKKFLANPFLILFLALVKVHVAQKNVSLPQPVWQNVVYAAFLQNLYLHYIPLNLLQQNHIFVCTVQLKHRLFGVLESIDFIISVRRLSTRTTMSIDTNTPNGLSLKSSLLTPF